MKPDREAYLRRVSAPSGPWVQLTGAMLREVFDEVDALRRLPVVSSCVDCAYFVEADNDDETPAMCVHGGVGESRDILDDGDPPAWCPLRGAR